MSELTDFAEARKRRRRKKTIRRTSKFLVVLIILAALVLVGFVAYRMNWSSHFSNLIASLQTGGGYPVSLNQGEVSQIVGMNGSVAVCASGNISVYNGRGVMTGHFSNNYASSVSIYSGGKLLTYDLGGSDWMTSNNTKVLQKQSDTGKILAATINEKGYVAVSRRNTSYISEVKAYNARGAEMYIWDSNDSFVNQLALSHSGTLLATGGILSGGGQLSSVVKIHDMTGGREETSLSLPGCTILSMTWTGRNRLQVVTDQGIHLLSKEGSEIASVTFEDTPVAAENPADGVIYIATGDYRSSNGATVTAYNSDLQPSGTTQIKEHILAIRYDSRHVFILTEEKLLVGNPTLSEVTDRGQGGLQTIAPCGSIYYGLTNEGLVRERM